MKIGYPATVLSGMKPSYNPPRLRPHSATHQPIESRLSPGFITRGCVTASPIGYRSVSLSENFEFLQGLDS